MSRQKYIDLLCDSCKTEVRLCTKGFVTWTCERCSKESRWSNGCPPQICADCAKVYDLCPYCQKVTTDE